MEKKKLNGYYNYTVILTYIGMLAGFIGIAMTMENRFKEGLLCLMIAGFCDMFDGAIASTRKRTDNEKKFGIQIDSLSDLICFGVLPGLFVYCYGKSYTALAIGCFYTLCALIRLAYFNVIEEERQKQEDGCRTGYQGLPVTTAAILLPLVFLLGRWLPYGSWILQGAAALMAIAFVSPFYVRKPHTLGKIVMALIGTAELVLLLTNVGVRV